MVSNPSHMNHFDSTNQSIMNAKLHNSKRLCSLENAFFYVLSFKPHKNHMEYIDNINKTITTNN